jgi:hypothetical protein
VIISSRTPEGSRARCAICGKRCRLEPSLTTGDAVCPHCGCLLWFGNATESASVASGSGRLSPALRPSSASPLPCGPRPAAGRLTDAFEIDAPAFWAPANWPPLNSKGRQGLAAQELWSWEQWRGLRLPRSLSRGLMLQNGGRVLDSPIFINPLQKFVTLNESPWTKCRFDEFPGAASRGQMLQIGSLPGGEVLLDFRRSGEPRARGMDLVFAGKLIADYASFDHLVEAARQRLANA